MKKLFRMILFILSPLLKIFFSLFYDKKYMSGKYFKESCAGWYWIFKYFIPQKIFRINGKVRWPMSPFSSISNCKNIIFNEDDLNNFQTWGCYFQNISARIFIGKGTYIAPNVGLITSNHDMLNLDKHSSGKDIVIGECCWIGMNSVVLPGVSLGDHTIVGAGSIVTKSFKEGNCIIAGNPAKQISCIKKEDSFQTKKQQCT